VARIVAVIPVVVVTSVLVAVSVFAVACTSGPVAAPVGPGVAPPVTPGNRAQLTLPAAIPVPPAPTAIPIPAPESLTARTDRPAGLGPIWVRNSVELSASAPAVGSDSLALDVEVVAANRTYLGKPTDRGEYVAPRNGTVDGTVEIAGLPAGRYVWQARFVNEAGVAGPWRPALPNAEIGFVGPAPKVTNLTVVGAHGGAAQGAFVGKSDHPGLSWQVQSDLPDSLSTVAYLVDANSDAPTDPPTESKSVSPDQTTAPLPSLKDGRWYAHVWATDKSGQVGPPATVPLVVQTVPPAIQDLVYRTFATNPRYQTLPIRFTVSQASVVDVAILPENVASPVRSLPLGQQPAGKQIAMSWDGKNQNGQVVAAGGYRFEIQATDLAGNVSQVARGDLTITNKVILVSLASESLRAMDGDHLFLTTLVTSGGEELPTRPGHFEVEYKASPFVFHSPYPRGTKFWYPDTPANYVMLFDPQQGNFIHDAPWRTVFGPGSNGPGTPGYSVYSGSHGCVELPTASMKLLYAWTPPGTPVIVQ